MAYPIVMTRLGFNHTGEQANNISLHWTPLLEPLFVLLPPIEILLLSCSLTNIKLKICIMDWCQRVQVHQSLSDLILLKFLCTEITMIVNLKY